MSHNPPGQDPPSGRPATPPTTGRDATRCWACGTAIHPGAACHRCGADGPAPPRNRGAGAFLARLGKGAGGPFRGIAFLGRHPRLWSFVIAPLVINTLLFGVGVWVAATYLDDWIPDLDQEWPAWIDWARTTLGWLVEALIWLVSVAAASLDTLLISGVINAPFYDLLSEKVEKAHFGLADPGRPFSALLTDIGRSLLDSLSLLARWGLVMVVLFALSFTAVGAPLFAVASWYYLGLAQLDITLARKLYKAGQRTAWARRHFPLVVGLGLPVAFVPLLAPFAIVGATLAFLDEPDKA